MSTNKKYKLVNKQSNGLYQIQALRDIPRWKVKKGDLGGFIEGEHNLSQEGDCWVSGSASVYGLAHVYGKAHVSGEAHVFGKAYVSDSAHVFGKAYVSGEACVFGKARVYGEAYVSGEACVFRYMQAKTKVKQFDLTPYKVILTDSHVAVGCHDFTIEELLYGTNLDHALAEGLTKEQYEIIIKVVEYEFNNENDDIIANGVVEWKF